MSDDSIAGTAWQDREKVVYVVIADLGDIEQVLLWDTLHKKTVLVDYHSWDQKTWDGPGGPFLVRI